jgi:hypothetical protein
MTTLNHIAQSYLLTRWTKKKWLIITAIVLSAAPDLGRLFQSDPSNWNLFYRWAHNAWYLYLIPFWNLHIAEDYFIHKHSGGWQPWAIYVEIISWIIMAYIYRRILVNEKKKDSNK